MGINFESRETRRRLGTTLKFQRDGGSCDISLKRFVLENAFDENSFVLK